MPDHQRRPNATTTSDGEHDDHRAPPRGAARAARRDGVDGRGAGIAGWRSQLAHLLAADDVDEERCADQRGDDADVDLLGPRDEPADDVGGGQQARAGRAPRTAAASGGRRRPAAGTRAARPARRSRWARRRRSAAPQSTTAPRAATAPGERDVLTEPGGEVVAEGERVQAARGERRRSRIRRRGTAATCRCCRRWRRRRRRSARTGTLVGMSLRGRRIALTSEVNAAEVAAPASASLSGVAPPRPSEPTV